MGRMGIRYFVLVKINIFAQNKADKNVVYVWSNSRNDVHVSSPDNEKIYKKHRNS